GDLEGEGADLERRRAAQGSGVGAVAEADHLEQLALDGLGEFVSELLGSDVLAGGERPRHGTLTEYKGGFLAQAGFLLLGYKESTNLRDAHTRRPARTECARHIAAG